MRYNSYMLHDFICWLNKVWIDFISFIRINSCVIRHSNSKKVLASYVTRKIKFSYFFTNSKLFRLFSRNFHLVGAGRVGDRFLIFDFDLAIFVLKNSGNRR